jgi:NADPH:quinone reductase-like Zn-dependent oxidoreductase
MQAVVWTAYGRPDVLELRQLDVPEPAADQVRVRVRATTVTAGDCEMRALRFPLYLALAMRAWIGWRRPRGWTVAGTEFAGIVDAVGAAASRFDVGDRVFGSAGMRLGAAAEYLCLAESSSGAGGALALMPANMTFQQAATVPFGGRDALHFMRKAALRRGQRILINGAGGSIGTFAVQLAKRVGAQVTAVDDGSKLDMLRALGADHVIDFTREDFTQRRRAFDVIFDVVGTVALLRARRALRPGGTFILANPPASQMFASTWFKLSSGPAVFLSPTDGSVEDLETLRELIEADGLQTVIDRVYPLQDIVEAHEYVETGAKQGHVVITIEDSGFD